MSACLCPEMPAIETIPSEPIKCVCCGSPLELRCELRCGKTGVSIRRAGRKRAPLKEPRKYWPKLCVRCREEYQPTGPRSSFCPACKAGKT